VAGAFATRLALRGESVLVLARDAASAQSLAQRLGPNVEAGPNVDARPMLGGITRPSAAIATALRDAHALVFAVSDDALEEVAEQLAEVYSEELANGPERNGPVSQGPEPSGPGPRVALHTSGSRGRDALASFAARGWSTGSVHPLAALAPGGDGAALASAWFALEGDEPALVVARELVHALRGEDADRGPGGVAGPGGELLLSAAPDAKLLYHAGASLVSGAVVAVLELAEGCLVRAGVAPDAARAALGALAASAVENVLARGPAAALTGPAARGDVPLVARQLAALEDFDALEAARAGGPAEAARAGGPAEAARAGGPAEAARAGGPAEAARAGGPAEAARAGGPAEAARAGGPAPARSVSHAARPEGALAGASEVYCALLPTLARLAATRPGVGPETVELLLAVARGHRAR